MTHLSDYHRFIEAIGAGITFTRVENPSTLVFANKSFYSLTGYTPEEVLGRNCNLLQGPDTNIETVDEIRKAIYTGSRFAGEILNYRKNGEPFWNFLVINPIHDIDGILTHFAGFQHDITYQKQSEKELVARTKEFNTFVYRASHDLRGPLASVLGLSQADDEMLADELAMRMKMVNKTAQNLDGILHKFIRTIELQEYILKLENIAFKPLAESVFREIIQLPEHENALHIHIRPEEIITTDRLVLSTLLKNIFENSIQNASPNRPLQIEVNLIQNIDNIQIAISDNGNGIDKELQPQVFDMFVKGNTATGSGLGLYLAKQCAQKLGGHIWLQSQAQSGTEVFLLLPSW